MVLSRIWARFSENGRKNPADHKYDPRGRSIRFSNEKEMIGHTEKFGLLTDIIMVSEILLIISVVQVIYLFFKQLAGTVGSNFVFNVNICIPKE